MSVLEWSESLPVGWSTHPLKRVAVFRNSNVDKKSYENGNPVRLCNYTDVYYNEFISPKLGLMEATATLSEIARFSLEAGDVIITKDSESWDDIAVPACVTQGLEGVVCGYHLTLIRPHVTKLHGPFLLRCLQATGIREQLWISATGVTRFGLGQDAIGGAVIPIPPLPIQQTIADFLDRKTAAIDELIRKKERLIELLQEKRQALITQAVTKGLDPNVPMKDSGIEWLGEIPAHWEIAQLGHKITLQRGVDITKDEQREGLVPVVSSGGVSSYHDTALCDGPGVVVGRKGSAGSVHWVLDDYWPHDTTLYIKRWGDNSRKFIYYKLLAMNLAGFDTGSANPTINRNLVHRTHLPWPPVVEQRCIADVLDHATGMLSQTVKNTQDSIRMFMEYRQALISAAVTGQLPIPEPEPTP